MVLSRLTWADWSVRCRSEDRKPHVEPVRHYTWDNIPEILIETMMVIQVGPMVRERLHPGFPLPPALIRKEMASLVGCYVGLADELHRLLVAEY